MERPFGKKTRPDSTSIEPSWYDWKVRPADKNKTVEKGGIYLFRRKLTLYKKNDPSTEKALTLEA